MIRRLGLFLLLFLATAHSGEGEVQLLTDEALPRYLARGQQLARSGEWAKMIDILQRVIVGDNEIFPELTPETLNSAVHTNDGVLYYPARELCVRELSQLPPEGLAVYRATYDVPAAELMKEAATAETLEKRLLKYTSVFDTYLVSSSGDDALDEAASLHLQLGNYFECLALLRRLLELYPGDSDRDLAMARTKAAYCAARIGDSDTRNDMLEQLAAEAPGRRVLVEGERVAVEDLAAHPVMKVIGAIDLGGADDWPMAGGNPMRNRLCDDLPADLKQTPFWRYSLQKRDSRYTALGGNWVRLALDRDEAVAPSMPEDLLGVAQYPTVRPVVHDNVLYFKDYVEVVLRRLGSGEFVSSAFRGRAAERAEESAVERSTLPGELVRPGTGARAKDPTRPSLFESAYRWYDYGGNDILVTSSHYIYTQTLVPPMQFILPGSKPPDNALAVADVTNGVCLWQWDQKGDIEARSLRHDKEKLAAWQRDQQAHRNAYFRGPGVVAGGILYTLAEEHDGSKDHPGGVAMWAMRVADGRVLYRTQLHQPDEVQTRLPASASISVAGAVAYVLTNAGILAAVDALPPGRIRWIRRYPRSFGQRARGAAKRLHIVFAHNEPVIAGGKVLILPADGSRLQAIDAETGRLDWELEPRDLGDVRHIVGVRNQTVVLAGSSVTAVDLQRGKVLWSHEHIGGGADGQTGMIPYGRGFLSEKLVYIPAVSWLQRRKGELSYIHRFEIDGGKRLDQSYKFAVPRLGNILCVGGRLIACNEDEVMCFTSPEHEMKQLAARLESNEGTRSEILLECALVTLRADPGRRDEALGYLRDALAAADSEGRRGIEIRWRLIELLLEKAESDQSAEPLDEAREAARKLKAITNRPPRDKYRSYEAQIAFVDATIPRPDEDAREAIRRLDAFVTEFGNNRVRIDGEIVDAPTAARAIRARWMEIPEFRGKFEAFVRERIADAVEKRDKQALASIPEQLGAQPPAEEAWFALARLHAEDKEPAEAETALRVILRDFPKHPRCAEARLRLALLLAEANSLVDARQERDRGLAELDADARARFADLIAELAKRLPEEAPEAARPKLDLPLRAIPFEVDGATPIPVEGIAPEALQGSAIVAENGNWTAVDAHGKVLWRVRNAAGSAISAGNPSEPGTLSIASALANARFARWIDGDLVVGDVAGVQRIDGATGNVLWTQPRAPAQAADAAAAKVKILADALAELAREGHRHRESPLPAHVVRADTIIRVDPSAGVTAYSLETGAPLWSEESTGGIAGPPSLVGQLLVVGRVEPGSIDVYDVGAGRLLRRLKAPGAVVLDAPKLDRLGRVFVIAGADRSANDAALHVIDVEDGRKLIEEPVEVYSRYAAVLHADESLAVLHDGSSGGENLHFLELDAKRHVRIATEDLSREYHVLRDGAQLYVLTHKSGLQDEGARLFRIDATGRGALRYKRPTALLAYGRPLLTERYVVVAGSDGRHATVQLFEREASKDLSPPAAVFPVAGGSIMNAAADFEPPDGVPPRFELPPALAAAGSGLVVGHPFGVFRLRAGDAR